MSKHKANRIYSSARQPKKEDLQHYLFYAHENKKDSAEKFLERIGILHPNPVNKNGDYFVYSLSISYEQERIINDQQGCFVVPAKILS